MVNLLMMRVENRDLDFFSRKMNLNVSTEYHPSQTIYFFFPQKELRNLRNNMICASEFGPEEIRCLSLHRQQATQILTGSISHM